MPELTYVEEREFTLRIQVRCAFPENYEGDDDGYAWWSSIEPSTADIVRAAAAILGRLPGCRVRPTNRGRPADEEVTLLVDRTP